LLLYKISLLKFCCMLYPRFYFNFQIFPKSANFPICRNPFYFPNMLIHTYYILLFKIINIYISKKKEKCQSRVTTPTTSLNPAPPVENLSYPLCFSGVTTGLRQVTTLQHYYIFTSLITCNTAFYDLSYVVGSFLFSEN